MGGGSARTWTVQQLADAVRAAALAGDPGGLAGRVCSAAARAAGAQGVTLCAVFVPGMSVPVGVSDARAALAEELQFSFGEGPCWQALASGEVVVADLSGDGGAVGRRPGDRAGGVEDGELLWPDYVAAVQREVGYGGAVSMPVVLRAGLSLVFTVFGRVDPADPWWGGAEVVVAAVQEVLDAASSAALPGAPAWLDSASALRRGAVWVAEEALMDHGGVVDREVALAALRTFSLREGVTVDAVAAALVEGRADVQQVLTASGPLG